MWPPRQNSAISRNAKLFPELFGPTNIVTEGASTTSGGSPGDEPYFRCKWVITTSVRQRPPGRGRLAVDDTQQGAHGAVGIAPALLVGLHRPRGNAENTFELFG